MVGGGYAGLSCLMELADVLPDSRRILVDPMDHHLRQTRLQEGLRRPLADLCTSFSDLGEQYGFRHREGRPSLTARALDRAEVSGRLRCAGVDEPFDVLVVAVGARPRPRPVKAGCVGLADLKRMDGRRLIGRILRDAGGSRDRVTVVGGGATGLQYLFELRDALRREGAATRLALVDPGRRLLPEQPGQFHDYVVKRMAQARISHLGGYRLASAGRGRLTLVGRRGGRRKLSSAISLVLTGLTGNPSMLRTTPAGHILRQGEPRAAMFAAGDCSFYEGGGLNSASAQAAVRKGRLVAANIGRLARGRELLDYRARELGFFLSLGMLDGVGWMGNRKAVVTGAAAFAVREAIEARYELFVRGLDTFQLL